MSKRIKNATLNQIVESISDELDAAWSLIDEQARMLKHGELGELIDMLGAQKDQNAELMETLKTTEENEKLARDVIAKQASKLSDLGHGGAEDLGVAEKFLEKARAKPITVGMKLLFTPIRTGIIKEHGNAEPQAWTTQRLFSEHCVSGYRQLKWNRGQVAKTKAKLREMGVDPNTGEVIAYIADGTNPERDSEISANSIQFFEERMAWEQDICAYWESYLNTAKALFLEKTDDEWQVPEWLTRERKQQPVSKERVPGKDVVAALKAGLKADVADLI